MPPSTNEAQVNTVDRAAMVWIDAGDFVMGSSEADIVAIMQEHPDWRADWFSQEKPQRVITLPGFWIYRDPADGRAIQRLLSRDRVGYAGGPGVGVA